MIVIPINCGKLGFLLSNEESDIDEIILSLDKNDYLIDEIIVFKALINKNNIYHFINDLYFMSVPLPCKFDLQINDHIVKNNFMSGFLISTTVGSSAFNKSLKGPIFLNKDNKLIFNPIAPVNNLLYKTIVNPLIISDIENFRIENIRNGESLVIDGKLINIKNIKNIEFSSKIKKVQTLSLKKRTMVESIIRKIL